MAEVTPQRYSDKRLADPFTVYVLFSEELEFLPSEILAAVRADYPGLGWSDTLGFDAPFRTGGVGLAAFLPDDAEETGQGVVHINTFPGRLEVDWQPVFAKSWSIFPEAQAAVARHRTYLAINVDSLDRSLPARFDAARRATCLAAVFARLPICTAVYFPSGDTIVTPANWVRAADTAMAARFPILEWFAFAITPVPDGTSPPPVTVQTIGMAAFNGHEIVLPLVRENAAELVKWAYGAATMLLEYGHAFSDGHTMGIDGDDSLKLRIRHLPEGKLGAQTDMWALFHPKSTLDDEAMLGPRAGRPPPPGLDTSFRGDPDTLKKRLYRFFAGGRA